MSEQPEEPRPYRKGFGKYGLGLIVALATAAATTLGHEEWWQVLETVSDVVFGDGWVPEHAIWPQAPFTLSLGSESDFSVRGATGDRFAALRQGATLVVNQGLEKRRIQGDARSSGSLKPGSCVRVLFAGPELTAHNKSCWWQGTGRYVVNGVRERC